MNYFKFFDQEDIDKRVAIRPGETKLGENIKSGFQGELGVIIGVPESIGVRANLGKAGTESLWPAFLDSFLNIQQQEKLNGDEFSILGEFDFSSLLPGEGAGLENWRNAVEQIDLAVFELVKEVVSQGKLPIVIGGGHNNSYPIIKGVAKGLASVENGSPATVNVLNLDAHADFRKREGRHSGNGFRYAFEEGFLNKYIVLGLSENYNSLKMLEDMKAQPNIDFVFWEDIFLRKEMSFEEAIDRGFNFVKGGKIGVELDLDVVGNVLSSAMDPVGISGVQARAFVSQIARKGQGKLAYLHICEGAVKMADGRGDFGTAKLVSYLATDFIKGVKGY